jgi:hypothetical protein
MTPPQVIAEIISIALKFGPAVVEAVGQVVQEFQAQHPELTETKPPEDVEDDLNREILRRIEEGEL